MASRDSKILNILIERKEVEVAVLADELGVSKVTIRKDLDSLKQRGLIHRRHGYVMLSSTDNVQGRLAYHYEEKLRIAQAACELVEPGETVMIESGSCCALLALILAETCRDVTIITNSAFIAGYIRTRPYANVVLLGGFYQNDAEVLVGPLLAQACKRFNVARFFVGADGFTAEAGFTSADQFRAQAVRDMAGQAGEVIVLTESDKFSKRGVVPLDLGGKVTRVITDDKISDASRADLAAAGIAVTSVPTKG